MLPCFQAPDLNEPTEVWVEHVLQWAQYPRSCLGLELGATKEAGRKRYLSLALRLHPDKAQHPRAAEAFAAVEAAWRHVSEEP